MAGGCAIYIGDNPMRQQTNPFGKDIANRGLFRAFAEHGPWDDQLFLVHNKIDDAKLTSNLFDGEPAPKPILSTSILNHREISARGTAASSEKTQLPAPGCEYYWKWAKFCTMFRFSHGVIGCGPRSSY